tara:strand:+ start:2521 stop:2733 length:213 start_codon:yes stop_codon:yes gene_type:complete
MSDKKIMTDEGELVDAIYTKEPKKRKSLAIDEETYELLRDICHLNRRPIIQELAIIIENRYTELFDGASR